MANYIEDLRKLVGNTKVILVGCGVLVLDAEDRLLLHRRTDNGKWGIPSGFMELGEQVEQTARREVYEETGLSLGRLDFFGIYSGKEREVTLPNGHELMAVKIAFTCREYQGEPRVNDHESHEVRFFALDELPTDFNPTQLHYIEDLLSGAAPPFIK
ncbi:ADP-ribose pyrophosphatase YjhB (NUDIX family) [Tumebacillus sp. BK434]|uniref:NUDIX hydrolase n=1 Tax=Tumebacillus sp. BK434 TaxID=2512169 RepID=UPI00104B8339|nr:NUDIX domain-containing protein [Tumebacillus sp. BK434]TCP58174.1 ADP-ribose pyrophosphatase YjhB (NUDIX family) [Tumebacillus sp. BK434]